MLISVSVISQTILMAIQAWIKTFFFSVPFYAEKVNDGIESSEYLYRRPYKRVHTSESFPQMPEPVYSSRRTRESVNSKRRSFEHWAFRLSLNDGLSGGSSGADNGLSEEEKEHFRISRVDRKKDFVHIERIGGKPINVLQGLELHTQVFNAEEQKQIVECIYEFQRMGQKGMLRGIFKEDFRKYLKGWSKREQLKLKESQSLRWALESNFALFSKGRHELHDIPLHCLTVLRWEILLDSWYGAQLVV